jgi:stearoyl-CoA desaturase (delta-9 desaturase)
MSKQASVDLSPPATRSLPLPQTVQPGRILWMYAVPIVVIHLLALLACVPWLFSWVGLIVAVLGIHVFGQSITIGYHRLLTHHSFKTPKWVERLIVIVAQCCLQDTPARWVATHRYHHLHSDEQEDPHTPLVAFFWGHVGWLLVYNSRSRSIDTYEKYARDILRDPFYMWLERTSHLPIIYSAHALLYYGVGAVIGWLTGGTLLAAVQMGLSLMVWGVFVRTVAVWHITWSVNSLSHLFGYQNYNTEEHSRNNWLVALLSVGEGWHNNHHHDQAAASVQHRWWEIDISYYEIRLMQLFGLASDVIPIRQQRVAQREAQAAAREGQATAREAREA